MNKLRGIIAALVVMAVVSLSQVTSPRPSPPLIVAHLQGSPKKVTPSRKSSSLIQPGNLHFIFTSREQKLKVFDYQGQLLYRCPCKNDTFNVGFLHWGACPHGTFRLGRTVSVHAPAYGKYFTPLYDLSPSGPMHHYHRTGIGLHAGGSKLLNPFSDYQQLLRTHGCLRVSNHDQGKLVRLIHNFRAKGHVSYITVQ